MRLISMLALAIATAVITSQAAAEDVRVVDLCNVDAAVKNDRVARSELVDSPLPSSLLKPDQSAALIRPSAFLPSNLRTELPSQGRHQPRWCRWSMWGQFRSIARREGSARSKADSIASAQQTTISYRSMGGRSLSATWWLSTGGRTVPSSSIGTRASGAGARRQQQREGVCRLRPHARSDSLNQRTAA
jgi:hypothetical protein